MKVYLGQCSVPNCSEKQIVSTNVPYCAAHYRRLLKHGDVLADKPVKKRVWGSTLAKTPEHKAWVAMRERCCKPTHPSYASYGGRGITVCARWDESENFLADMGPRPTPQHSLERLDNNKGYSPDNCVWADKKQQRRNQRTRTVTSEQVEQIRALRSRGLEYAEIGERVGLNKATVGYIVRGEHWSTRA